MTKADKIEVPTGLALLRQPFPDNQISKLPKPTAKREVMDKLPKAKCSVCGGYHATSKVIHLDYVGHAALTDRLLDCDPEWNWEPVCMEGLPNPGNGMWIKLTVCGVSRLGYGSADGKQGGDAIKEIIGDALRNAAMRFGAALDLWHKGDLHADEPVAGELVDEGQSQNGAVSPPANEMPDAEWARLVQLVEATRSDTNAMCKYYRLENLRHLNQDQYGKAIEALNAKLAKMAKEETDAKAKKTTLAEELEDEIQF